MNTKLNQQEQSEEIGNENVESVTEETKTFEPTSEKIENPPIQENEEEEEEEEEDDEDDEEEKEPEPARITRTRRVYPTINEFYLTTDNLIFLSYQKKEAWEHQQILGQGEISIY